MTVSVGDSVRYFGTEMTVLGFDETGGHAVACIEDRAERDARSRAAGALAVLREWQKAHPGEVPQALIDETEKQARAGVPVARVRLDLLTYSDTDGAWVRQ